MDAVILSLVAILPALAWSYRRARLRKYSDHRAAQVVIAVVLGIVVSAFEFDLQRSGGIFEMTRESSFAGSWFLTASVYFHMCFSFSTAVLWLFLISTSLMKFPDPPQPNSYSASHRFWGRIAMVDLVLTGITGLELYIIGFCL